MNTQGYDLAGGGSAQKVDLSGATQATTDSAGVVQMDEAPTRNSRNAVESGSLFQAFTAINQQMEDVTDSINHITESNQYYKILDITSGITYPYHISDLRNAIRSKGIDPDRPVVLSQQIRTTANAPFRDYNNLIFFVQGVTDYDEQNAFNYSNDPIFGIQLRYGYHEPATLYGDVYGFNLTGPGSSGHAYLIPKYSGDANRLIIAVIRGYPLNS